MKLITLIIVIVFAVAGPRMFGLIDANSTIMQSAMWGAAFGAAGGLVGGILQKLFGKE